MSDNDITKMRVADLKRELKLRGLSTIGNKNELQDRLQTALLDGDLSFEETAIAGADILDEDILTDEEKTAETDEKELLQSPTTESPKTLDEPLEEDTPKPDDSESSKKVVLKRKLITTCSTEDATIPTTEKAPPKKIVWSNLTDAEKKDLRAQKFGISSTKTEAKEAKKDDPPISDDKQLELLKKRAERFGCVTSTKMAVIEGKENLEKRKQRFGGGGGGGAVTVAAVADTAVTTDAPIVVPDGDDAKDYAEKARLRLERFKN